MTLKDIIVGRYSCRRFMDRPVDREKIISCIDAARMAPSACNSQPWKFIVLDEAGIRSKTATAAVSGIYRASRFLTYAPVLILVLADKGSFLARAGSLVRDTRFYLLDIGIACEHLVLQAQELGLSTCYVGWFNEKAVKKGLGIPRNIHVPLIIPMGYQDPEYRTKDPIRRLAGGQDRKAIDDILYFNGYR